MTSRSAAKRGANGTGSIRERTRRSKNGKQIKYWEGRVTVGFDPWTGKQIQRSVTGNTQKEVTQELNQRIHDMDIGEYVSPADLTVSEWLDDWAGNFLTGVKPRTKDSYRTTVETHLKPMLGKVVLQKLTPRDVQVCINRLTEGMEEEGGLSAKTVKNIHGVLHKALEQAVALGYLAKNPATGTNLPRVMRKRIHPFTMEQVKKFVRICHGLRFGILFLVTLFTGAREGEILGLTWDCVDFDNDLITIEKQLQKVRKSGGKYRLVPTKTDKTRYIRVAPFVMDLLRKQKAQQSRGGLRRGARGSIRGGWCSQTNRDAIFPRNRSTSTSRKRPNPLAAPTPVFMTCVTPTPLSSWKTAMTSRRCRKTSDTTPRHLRWTSTVT